MNHSYDFKIVLLHEDLVSGIRGMSVLERLAGQLEMESEKLDIDIWKFAVLRNPDLRVQATDMLKQANMIIISAGGRAELPGHVREIIEKALGLRQERDAAIVALLDWDQAATNALPQLGLYLENLAATMDMDFFCNKGAWQPSAETAGDSANGVKAGRFANSRATIPWNS
jgi:hypothetical protein